MIRRPIGLTADDSSANRPTDGINSYTMIPQGVGETSGTLWGAPILATTSITAGDALVMSVKAGAGVFCTRMAMTLQYKPGHSDTMWSTNTQAYRIEERIAVSVPRPAAQYPDRVADVVIKQPAEPERQRKAAPGRFSGRAQQPREQAEASTPSEESWPFLNPDVTVKPEVRFLADCDEGINFVPAEDVTMKVRVCEPFRVVHKGTVYTAPQEFDAPADDKTKLWLHSGYVELATKKGK